MLMTLEQAKHALEKLLLKQSDKQFSVLINNNSCILYINNSSGNSVNCVLNCVLIAYNWQILNK